MTILLYGDSHILQHILQHICNTQGQSGGTARTRQAHLSGAHTATRTATQTGTHTATHRDDEVARHELDRLIFQELTLGSFTPAARLWLESRISLFCHVKGSVQREKEKERRREREKKRGKRERTEPRIRFFCHVMGLVQTEGDTGGGGCSRTLAFSVMSRGSI